MKEPISIFNDVLGPVMRGPSSSHTAGAYRLACMARMIFGGVPKSVICSFDPEGSFAPTYLALGVDKAFCAGLLGVEMESLEYESSVTLASERMDICFKIESLEFNNHPNTMKIEIIGERNCIIWGSSTGGGNIEIFRFNNFSIMLTGKCLEYLIVVEDNHFTSIALKSFMGEVGFLTNVSRDQLTGTILYHYSLDSSRETPNESMVKKLAEVEELQGVLGIHTISPIFSPIRGLAEFHSAQEILVYTDKEECSLGEAGIKYEQKLLGLSRIDVIEEMIMRFTIMKQSISDGMNNEKSKMQWLKPHAASLMKAQESKKLPFGGAPTRAAIRALAVMHTCNSKGIICAAPTGGSAGVLAGTVVTLEEELPLKKEETARVLFAAGLVGMIIAERATFAAEVAGCQVEIGAAGAMAAAAVVEAHGGSAEDALHAASIALQNTMGLVCDPVGGGCEIPCHSRNAAAAASAFTCADLILGGYPNPILFDEAVDASYSVGRQLPSDLRCTARGGIAITPSALNLVR